MFIVGLVLAAVGSACTTADEVEPQARRIDDVLVVASFNFPESRLLAEVYAAALAHAGVPVRVDADLGPRELVAPALAQGFVDVVPEYLGEVAPTNGVRVLTPAPAQNQNAVVVTRTTAERLNLKTIGDLADDAGSLTIGGPPECPSRRYCMVGLADVYGVRFGSFMPLNGAGLVRRALQDGVVDVAVMFTTDGHLASGDLVLLEDDRHLQPAENVVPMVREQALTRFGETRIVAALNDVSARLTTTALRLLNWRVSVAGKDPLDEARGWLVRQGVIPR